MTNINYRLEHLSENLTEDGIHEIKHFIENERDDVNTLSTFLFETSPWFAHACVEYSNKLALQMVEEYLVASGTIDYEELSELREQKMESDFNAYFIGDSDIASI